MEQSDISVRIKEYRTRQGISQEQLADSAGLSLRTVQRIENGETGPRGDSLKRLAAALHISPDDILDWQVQEDRNVLILLNLSQLSLLVFPLLGIIIPLAIWILKKEKVKHVDTVGKAILNFQMVWCIVLFLLYALMVGHLIMHLPFPMTAFKVTVAGLYLYNIVLVVVSTIHCHKGKRVFYKPAFRILQ